MQGQAELELNILGQLLQKPELFQLKSINREWFIIEKYKHIYEAIEALNGDYSGVMEIWGELTLNGITETSLNELQTMANNSLFTSDFEKNVDLLEQCFLTASLQEVCAAYMEKPSKSNYENLLAFASVMNLQETHKDTGSLEKSLESLATALNEDIQPPSIKTFGKFDLHFSGGLDPGMLLTIGARPAVGKTAFASVNLAIKALERNEDLSVLVFSLEMPKREILARYISRLTGISTGKLKRPRQVLNDQEKAKVAQAMALIKAWDIKVFDEFNSIGQILGAIRRAVATNEKEKRLVIIDYLGLISADKGASRERRLQLEEITRELKIIANQLGLVIVLLSQLNRGIEGRPDKTPQLSDLRESGSIEQDSNVVGFLYQDEENKEITNFIIRKNREGTQGTIQFKFDGSKMLFEEVFQ